jgi:NADPH:quinone reductase-like Zn-dependent oxidoreductase
MSDASRRAERAGEVRRGPRSRGQSAAAPAAAGADPRPGFLVNNAGGSPGQVFGPIAGILRVAIADRFVRQRLRPLPDTWTREHLLAVIGFIEAGDLTPVIDRTYPLADTAAGLRYLEQGHARGKVVVTVT